MRIHHLNCATFCPIGGSKVLGQDGSGAGGKLVAHCLLIESPKGLVLVDTGLGTEDVRNPAARLGRGFSNFAKPLLSLQETAASQVERLGFQRSDVRHIVLTHLDLDHAGGLSDFPHAAVHVYEPEHAAATARRSLLDRRRYRTAQWAHGPLWQIHRLDGGGDKWNGFDCMRAIDPKMPEIQLIPLTGHTRGHCGVAVQSEQGWLLHAGDAYFFHGEMDQDRPRCPHALRVFQRLFQFDGKARLENQARLRALANDSAAHTRVFCAHDPVELQRLGRSGT